MGNMCCDFFTSIPENPTHSLPYLILYKQTDLSTDNNLTEFILSPLELMKQNISLSEYDILPIEIIVDSSSILVQYLIKQILLFEINYSEKLKKNFINSIYQQYQNEFNLINEFKENYTSSSAIWWYRKKCFLYFEMNKIFHTENIEQLIKIGFFIRDLHQQIQQSNHFNTMIVYRGQGLNENQLENLKNNQNSFLYFKNFLWTNSDRTMSLNNARLTRNNSNLLGVLFCFEIKFNSKNENLFSIYSLFRIGEIKQIEDKIWEINLIFIENDDQYLKPIENNNDDDRQTAWQQLGFYLIQINQFNKVEQFYKILIEFNLINDQKHLAFLHQQLAFLYYKKNDFIHSLLHYKKSLKILSSSNDSNRFKISLHIGIIFYQQNNFHQAIKYFKYALNISLHTLPLNHLQISILYQYIAYIYNKQNIFLHAIQYYQSALENQLNHIPIHYSSIAKIYYKIGEIFYRMKDYTHALSYYNKTLQIQKKFLSPNHVLLSKTNYNIAMVLEGLQQYKEAIEYTSQAVNIARHSLGFNHKNVHLYEEYIEKLREKTFIGVIPNGAVYG